MGAAAAAGGVMLLLLVALTVDLRDERKVRRGEGHGGEGKTEGGGYVLTGAVQVLLQARPFPVAARMQRLKDFGVTWYSPVAPPLFEETRDMNSFTAGLSGVRWRTKCRRDSWDALRSRPAADWGCESSLVLPDLAPWPPLVLLVLETENEATRSTEARYPYVKYYGQPTPTQSFIHGTDLDPSFYNYMDGYETNEFDNTYEDYSTFLDSCCSYRHPPMEQWQPQKNSSTILKHTPCPLVASGRGMHQLPCSLRGWRGPMFNLLTCTSPSTGSARMSCSTRRDKSSSALKHVNLPSILNILLHTNRDRESARCCGILGHRNIPEQNESSRRWGSASYPQLFWVQLSHPLTRQRISDRAEASHYSQHEHRPVPNVQFDPPHAAESQSGENVEGDR
eukprot:762991-Hanusia_phi.AAC.1